jgi:hypothetical protein
LLVLNLIDNASGILMLLMLLMLQIQGEGHAPF